MLKILRGTLKNTIIYSIGTLSSKLIGFLLIPLYTSVFPVQEYGMLGILEITLQVLITVFSLGLSQAFFRWYWEKKDSSYQKELYFTILSLIFAASVSLGALIIYFQEPFSFLLFNTDNLTLLIRLLVFTTILEVVNIVTLTLIRLQEKAVLYSFLTTLKFLMQLLFTIYFISGLHMKLEGIYYAQILGAGFLFVASLPFMMKNIRFHFLGHLVKALLKYSFPLLLSSVTLIIFSVTDRYMLRFLADYKEVGIYSLGFKFANFLRAVIINSVNLALLPVIYKMINETTTNKRFYSKVMTYYTFGLMFFILAISFFNLEIIKVLSRRVAYWEAYRVIPVISFAILFGMLRDVGITGLNIAKKTGIIGYVTFFVAIFNLLLDWITIPRWGYMGAAFSTFTSQIVYFSAILFFAQKAYYIPYELKKIGIIFITGLILVIISQISNSLPVFPRILLKSGLIILYPFILYIFKFYDRIELESIKNIWTSWRTPSHWKNNIKRFIKSKTDT